MQIGTIGEIRRYPVKSMEGEVLSEVVLGSGGLPGDRAWAVRDEVRGGIRGAKKIAGLMNLKASYAADPPAEGSGPAQIVLPDGSKLETGAPDVNERLSQAVDHEVSLWPLLPAEALDHYRRGSPTHDDMLEELRSIFGRTPDEPLPNLGLFPPEVMEFESPPGTYFDAFPLTLMTDASLREMQRLAPDSRIDVRRFRPNLLIESSGDEAGFIEQAWRGQRLEIGEAIIEVTVECPRCVMVTHAFDDLPKDPSIMRTLVREAEGNLGVYGQVGRAGLIRAGDAVKLLPPS